MLNKLASDFFITMLHHRRIVVINLCREPIRHTSFQPSFLHMLISNLKTFSDFPNQVG